MRNYLSFGGGVNSVALYLLMEQLEMDFEAVFVDHGGDWPETYEYVDSFIATGRPVTVLKPEYKGCITIQEFCHLKKITPSRLHRWCTGKFKIVPLERYFKSPCFSHIGIDAGESHRAKLDTSGGREKRFLLVEHGIDRDGCKKIITDAGLTVPPKSGCYFCPFQRVGQWRLLRRQHPELFCEAEKMEQRNIEHRESEGKVAYTLRGDGKPLGEIVSKARESQKALPGMEDLEYPPCECGL